MVTNALLRLAHVRDLARTGQARQTRLDADLSLGELADNLRVTASTISRWERGLRVPRGAKALAYAELIDALQAREIPRVAGGALRRPVMDLDAVATNDMPQG